MSNPQDKLEFAFDVGHSSLGWSVLRSAENPEILACGTVLFPADDCLASHRRAERDAFIVSSCFSWRSG